MGKIFTIGHSNNTLDQFGKLLLLNRITAIADVRSQPFSQFSPHFNQNKLKTYLEGIGISYVFLGKELGARSNDSSCYVDGTVNYLKLSATKMFLRGIERLISGSAKYRIAAMCSEREPTECHRTILIARVLEEIGYHVFHILPNGKLGSGLID